jgi:hypothetical protein
MQTDLTGIDTWSPRLDYVHLQKKSELILENGLIIFNMYRLR